jgi:hypothetical protein
VGEFEDDYVRHHVLMWAEAVVRQVDRVRQQRKKDRADFHSYDQELLGAPMTYEVRRNFRTTQAEEHTLIWAAHQLEKWTQRWAIERDRTPPDPDPVLADVRNAMEHLYEADFDEHAVAVPGPFGSNRSLRKLPYGSVPRGVSRGSWSLRRPCEENSELRVRAARGAWVVLWFYPIFWVVHLVGGLPPGKDHIHQVGFIVLSMAGLLLSLRDVFGAGDSMTARKPA